MQFSIHLFLVWLKRDIKSRYAGSFAGVFWAVAGPVFTIMLFYFLFAFIFRVRIPELGTDAGYFYYLVAGLLPWLSISEGLSRAAGTVVAHEQFLQRQAFPVEILPLAALVSALLPHVIGSTIFLYLLARADLLAIQVLWLLPVAFFAHLVMTLGLGLVLASLAVHFRDLLHGLPLMLQFFFYATPILYQINMVPAEFQSLFLLNPFASVIMTYHSAFLGVPWTAPVALALLFWVTVLGVGGALDFRLLKPTLGQAA